MASVADLIKVSEKEFGDNVVTKGYQVHDVERLPTGVFAFDLATGGGIPRGRMSIFYGPPSSLKTSMALRAIGMCQKLHPDLSSVFVDVEASYDPSWAEKLGVDNDRLVYVAPSYAEQAVDLVEAFLQADDVGVVVIDSLAAMITSKEVEDSAEKAQVGGSALVVGKLYRRATHALNEARRAGRAPTLIAINQIRYKVGVMYGNPETMPGGEAFKFGSSMTVRLYGKDEMDKSVSVNLPAWKTVSGVIQKWKMPIFAQAFEARIATVANPDLGLSVGQPDDWKTVFSYVKQFGMMEKAGATGWLLLGKVYPTQADIRVRYASDPEFAHHLQQTITARAMAAGGLNEQPAD